MAPFKKRPHAVVKRDGPPPKPKRPAGVVPRNRKKAFGKKNAQKCMIKNCNRDKQRPSSFCKAHCGTVAAREIPVPPRALQKQDNKKKDFRLEEGFLAVVNISRRFCDKIQGIVKGWLKEGIRKKVLICGGVRKQVELQSFIDKRITNFETAQELERLIYQVSLDLTNNNPRFNYYRNNFHFSNVEFIIAPARPAGCIARRPKHRDIPLEDGHGCLTVMLTLDEITLTNGVFRLWKYSTLIPHSKENPNRYVSDGMPGQIDLTCAKDSLIAFDSRVIHQSLPNTSPETTWKLSWSIFSKDYLQRNPQYKTDENKGKPYVM